MNKKIIKSTLEVISKLFVNGEINYEPEKGPIYQKCLRGEINPGKIHFSCLVSISDNQEVINKITEKIISEIQDNAVSGTIVFNTLTLNGGRSNEKNLHRRPFS